ncbi:conidiation-specific protein 6 [Rhypophila decipiens]|uniref:Conidiation-specific protein 6 n=1 Tax=Rhypophila decipiens TaxID=261697 RepID=A0AAN6YIH9_9PEZI|nr:conidiation-specific protein 6 [Rhypophila decipiens]
MPTDAQIAGGHKANLKNPNTSEESKENSKKILENEFNVQVDGDNASQSNDDEGKNPNNVAGGLKATLKNPNVSDEAKESAKERLDNMSAS